MISDQEMFDFLIDNLPLQVKLPYISLYTGAWLSDAELNTTGLEGQGLLMRLLCLGHDLKPRGTFRLLNKPMTQEEILAQINCPKDQAKRVFGILLEAKVLRTLEDGTIYSRKALVNQHKRIQRTISGAIGGAETTARHQFERTHTDTTGSSPLDKDGAFCQAWETHPRQYGSPYKAYEAWELIPKKIRKIKDILVFMELMKKDPNLKRDGFKYFPGLATIFDGRGWTKMKVEKKKRPVQKNIGGKMEV